MIHCLGLPLHGSPLTFLRPQLPVDWCPHPSEEGRGRCSWHLLMALQVEVNQWQVTLCAEMWCVVMWFCLHKHYSGSISSKSNHLPSSPTSITCAPPSKDVGWVQKCYNMDAGPTALTLHYAISLNVKHWEYHSWSAPALLSATSLDIEHWGCLPWSATSIDIEHQGCFACLPLSFHPLFCHVTWR